MKFKYILKAGVAALVLALVISAVGTSSAVLPVNNEIFGNSNGSQGDSSKTDFDVSQFLGNDYNGSTVSQNPPVPEKIPDAEPEIPPAEPIEGTESTVETESASGEKPVQPVTPPSTGKTDKDESFEDSRNKKVLDVPYINQRTHFPNGCESVSAVMALQYFGVEISAGDFIRDYLDMGSAPHYSGGKLVACNPRVAFPGDPRNDSGWGCYPEVIKAAIDKMELESFEAVILKDVSLSVLCGEYIDNDIPVVFWGTIDMRKPSSWISWTIEGTDKVHTWTSPFHCLLLVGYDDEYYYFNDPWRQKEKRYGKDAVERAYTGIGREALVIVEK